MIRILIAEDSPYVLDGLSCLVRAQPDFDLVGTATDGQEALERALELLPDVVIMDAQMPRLDGVEATRILKLASPDVGVLCFSVFTEYLEASVVAGSDGYLCKDCEPAALFAEIRRIASRPPAEGLTTAGPVSQGVNINDEFDSNNGTPGHGLGPIGEGREPG